MLLTNKNSKIQILTVFLISKYIRRPKQIKKVEELKKFNFFEILSEIKINKVKKFTES